MTKLKTRKALKVNNKPKSSVKFLTLDFTYTLNKTWKFDLVFTYPILNGRQGAFKLKCFAKAYYPNRLIKHRTHTILINDKGVATFTQKEKVPQYVLNALEKQITAFSNGNIKLYK